MHPHLGSAGKEDTSLEGRQLPHPVQCGGFGLFISVHEFTFVLHSELQA